MAGYAASTQILAQYSVRTNRSKVSPITDEDQELLNRSSALEDPSDAHISSAFGSEALQYIFQPGENAYWYEIILRILGTALLCSGGLWYTSIKTFESRYGTELGWLIYAFNWIAILQAQWSLTRYIINHLKLKTS